MLRLPHILKEIFLADPLTQEHSQKFSHSRITAKGETRAFVDLQELKTLWINFVQFIKIIEIHLIKGNIQFRINT